MMEVQLNQSILNSDLIQEVTDEKKTTRPVITRLTGLNSLPGFSRRGSFNDVGLG
jgi:hypothetical protein